jgi:hypothetical protein
MGWCSAIEYSSKHSDFQVPGAGHNDIELNPQFLERLRDFIDHEAGKRPTVAKVTTVAPVGTGPGTNTLSSPATTSNSNGVAAVHADNVTLVSSADTSRTNVKK